MSYPTPHSVKVSYEKPNSDRRIVSIIILLLLLTLIYTTKEILDGSKLAWILLPSTLIFISLYLHQMHSYVISETFYILPQLGITWIHLYANGKCTSRFIPLDHIEDIVIMETFHHATAVYYTLAIISPIGPSVTPLLVGSKNMRFPTLKDVGTILRKVCQ